ncbi:MAG: hypothetical protein COV45_04800 [Deltaproteobacteria bacterium CG11_big_fil_rev_8_21_14_0_20_47_16]|nr:MAG: hypothetical protein COV45_04800 [Deltaproteobacteria bacterium CG11_big_fil_rev_8_21_14_0_20_47_16]
MLSTIYEDSDLWVLNKPAGMPTVRLPNSSQISIADILLEKHPNQSAVGSMQDCGIVHRLDNHTTGCLVVAKTNDAYQHLRQQFDQNQITKRYTALVVGQLTDTGQVTITISHMQHRATRMKCTPIGGQTAHTLWTTTRRYPISKLGAAGFSLADIQITTGVRHQIRVHMAHEGYPLAGDSLYQSRNIRNCDRLQLPHYLLHAREIEFTSPSSGQRIQCRADLADLFTTTLKRLDEIVKRH